MTKVIINKAEKIVLLATEILSFRKDNVIKILHRLSDDTTFIKVFDVNYATIDGDNFKDNLVPQDLKNKKVVGTDGEIYNYAEIKVEANREIVFKKGMPTEFIQILEVEEIPSEIVDNEPTLKFVSIANYRKSNELIVPPISKN